MSIPTSRNQENDVITIDYAKCTACGLCVQVCKDYSLEIRDGKLQITDQPVFGCIGCGHCMAVCPVSAIHVSGRTLTESDLFDLPASETASDYSQILNLMLRRRSIREFKKQPVEKEKIEQILKAASTAPMGLPPTDVHVLVFDSTEKIRDFSFDFCRYLEGMKWFVSGWFLALMRPFWGKENARMFKNFVKPLFKIYTQGLKSGDNYVTYDAPLAMYFYGSPYCDPADPIVAATYAMLAGESLGLRTCMLGAVHPLIQNGGKAKAFRKKWGIRHKSREGLFVIFGYPSVKYRKGISRTFAAVDFAK